MTAACRLPLRRGREQAGRDIRPEKTMKRIMTIAAGLALALTINAAPQIGRGTPPGSVIGDQWPIITAQVGGNPAGSY